MDPFALISPAERALVVPAPPPGSVEPMAATLTEERLSDPAWIFERTPGGIRRLLGLREEAAPQEVVRE